MLFPDTSSKRFGSYLHAIGREGLLDAPARVGLAVLALYLEAVSHSYVITVRGPGLGKSNALGMGPFLTGVVDHICKLNDKPDLILSPSAEPGAVTLTGCKNWRRLDAVQVMHSMHEKRQLTSLERMFVVFRKGTKKNLEMIFSWVGCGWGHSTAHRSREGFTMDDHHKLRKWGRSGRVPNVCT